MAGIFANPEKRFLPPPSAVTGGKGQPAKGVREAAKKKFSMVVPLRMEGGGKGRAIRDKKISFSNGRVPITIKN